MQKIGTAVLALLNLLFGASWKTSLASLVAALGTTANAFATEHSSEGLGWKLLMAAGIFLAGRFASDHKAEAKTPAQVQASPVPPAGAALALALFLAIPGAARASDIVCWTSASIGSVSLGKVCVAPVAGFQVAFLDTKDGDVDTGVSIGYGLGARLWADENYEMDPGLSVSVNDSGHPGLTLSVGLFKYVTIAAEAAYQGGSGSFGHRWEHFKVGAGLGIPFGGTSEGTAIHDTDTGVVYHGKTLRPAAPVPGGADGGALPVAK